MTVGKCPVVLVGYRCTGKSSVAPLVAQSLGWPWVDTDRLIVRRAGKTIREIFAEEGESGFRKREAELLRELLGTTAAVIATGGGVVLRAENRALLAPLPVVWLRARPEVILARLQADSQSADDRPPLTELDMLDEIRTLLRVREPLYREVAKLTIDTDELPVEQVAGRIVAWLHALPCPGPRAKNDVRR